jgi:alpha-beta hydrolase superfamily lysophospholipase
MRTDFYFDSMGGGKIHGCRWTPDGEVKAVVQLVHGIAEHVLRYDRLAYFLNEHGILVVAEDHMGHGGSVCESAPLGCFSGGWMAAVKDTYRLTRMVREEFAHVPVILYGHSMGSFMVRTILAKYPDSGIDAAVICGTGWMPEAVLTAGKAASGLVCKLRGRNHLSKLLRDMMFAGYNQKIEHPRTTRDWLTRDEQVVDAYNADPTCGSNPSAGLVNAMMEGILYIQKEENLRRMRRDLPVFFIAGGDDPVGGYGAGVEKAVSRFRSVGMERVDLKIYPLCRHEIHNELNKNEVYKDVLNWIQKL